MLIGYTDNAPKNFFFRNEANSSGFQVILTLYMVAAPAVQVAVKTLIAVLPKQYNNNLFLRS